MSVQINKDKTTLTASFQDNVGKPLLKCQTILDFATARDDGGGIQFGTVKVPGCLHVFPSKL